MSNPMDDVRYDGIGYRSVTFNIDGVTITYDADEPNGSASVGLAVKLSAAKTAALVVDGNAVEGRLERVESDGKCAVQVEGYMRFPGGNAATLTRGLPIVGALGAASAPGYVRTANSAVAAETVAARGRIEDATVTTDVLVWMP